MKFKTLLFSVATAGVLASCGVEYQAINFDKKRTPLNPIAHKGVINYNTKVVLTYAEEARAAQTEYETTVARNKQQYQEALQKYNNATPAERILQGLTKPELILPPQPDLPYLHDENQLAQQLKIEGMNRGTENALQVVAFYEGFNVSNQKVEKTTKKRKKDGVEIVDTVFVGQASVKNPVRLHVEAAGSQEYNQNVAQTTGYTTVKTAKYPDSTKARLELITKIDAAEKQLPKNHIPHINRLLDSQFGTKDVRYSVKLFKYKSNKNHDYSDLNDAVIQAQMGFKLLNSEPNKAYEKLANAFTTWNQALKEHSDYKKARINDKVKQGILVNLFAVSIFTDNWDGALKYMTELDNMKLKSAYAAEFNRLRGVYNDLKKRYDALSE
tara:strand:- start:138688 stop:139839 length:1152 start_codon:yes stop_codon:yes gene_type:complete